MRSTEHLPPVSYTHLKEEALKLLDRVGLLEKAEEPIKNLSGGQKQRVAIARALMRHPAILLADEPVASLDPVTGRQILELLKSINETDGVTILMNSHNLEFSQEFSDRLIGLKDGKVVFDGKTADPVSYTHLSDFLWLTETSVLSQPRGRLPGAVPVFSPELCLFRKFRKRLIR